ncbi:uncharacterized protein LOC144035678 [Vanacampus margaritifer]
MKRLLSCLLLASHCALSSRSDASALRVNQSADVNVLEGQMVNISCCWTGNFCRVKVEWLKNTTTYKNSYYPIQICHPTQQKYAKVCVSLEWANITIEDSGRYACWAKVDIPTLMEARGNGTVVTVTRQRSDGIAEGDVADKSGSPPWVLLGISLALVALLLLFALAFIFRLRQRKRVSRVIYEVPHLDSDVADMDKRSSGSSSAGSSQWCQVVVYESVDYFERVEKKQSG